MTDKYYLAEDETSLVFTVKTCSRVRVLLKKQGLQLSYQVEFPGADSQPSNITDLETGERVSQSSPPTQSQDCTEVRPLWISRANGVISGGSGWAPGKNELVRLADGKNRKDVAMTCTMSTEFANEDASFAIYRSKLLRCIVTFQ